MGKNRKPRDAQNLRYVVRLDSANTKGWQVRLAVWHPRGPGSQFFADSKYGSSEEALKQAQAFRNKVYEGLTDPGLPEVRLKNSRNSSGLLGVTLSSRQRPGWQEHWYWDAYWSKGEVRQAVKRFSVRRLGYIPAWEAAVAHRQAMTSVQFSDLEVSAARLQCLRYWAEHLAGRGLPLEAPE